MKNPPANAGSTGSVPGLGQSRVPGADEVHEPQPQGLRSRAHEPGRLEPACLEPMPHREWPCSLRLEKACTQQRRPGAAKKVN